MLEREERKRDQAKGGVPWARFRVARWWQWLVMERKPGRQYPSMGVIQVLGDGRYHVSTLDGTRKRTLFRRWWYSKTERLGHVGVGVKEIYHHWRDQHGETRRWPVYVWVSGKSWPRNSLLIYTRPLPSHLIYHCVERLALTGTLPFASYSTRGGNPRQAAWYCRRVDGGVDCSCRTFNVRQGHIRSGEDSKRETSSRTSQGVYPCKPLGTPQTVPRYMMRRWDNIKHLPVISRVLYPPQLKLRDDFSSLLLHKRRDESAISSI